LRTDLRKVQMKGRGRVEVRLTRAKGKMLPYTRRSGGDRAIGKGDV